MISLFLTGGSGTLGRSLLEAAESPDWNQKVKVFAPSSSEFDITDPEAIAEFGLGKKGKFDLLINAAAYTHVDRAETERELCYSINAVAPGWLARAATDSGVRMIHISTDSVFDGKKGKPYVESDPTHPLQTYGRSKLEGEEAVMATAEAVIIRTSWLFGRTGKSFPKMVLELLQTKDSIKMVADQVGTPTDASVLANLILKGIELDIPAGIYHAAGSEAMSRFEWANLVRKVFCELTGQPAPTISPVAASEFPTLAIRPSNSALNSEKFLSCLRVAEAEEPSWSGLPSLKDSTKRLMEFWLQAQAD